VTESPVDPMDVHADGSVKIPKRPRADAGAAHRCRRGSHEATAGRCGGGSPVLAKVI